MFEDIFDYDNKTERVEIAKGIVGYIGAFKYEDINSTNMELIRKQIKSFLDDNGYKDNSVNMEMNDTEFKVNVRFDSTADIVYDFIIRKKT